MSNRLPLQDCGKCGGRHYGPATATNCPKFRSGSGQGGPLAGNASSLASKSILPTAVPEEGRLILSADDEDIDLDRYTGVGETGIVVGEDGSVRENTDYPPEQGSYGDADEWEEMLSRPGGIDGWEVASTGWSNQEGYRGPVMHGSESLGKYWSKDIRKNPGEYAAVSVEKWDDPEDEDEYPEGDPVGWMLLRRTPESRERAKLTGAQRDAMQDIRKRVPFGDIHEDRNEYRGTTGLGKIKQMASEEIPRMLAQGDLKGAFLRSADVEEAFVGEEQRLRSQGRQMRKDQDWRIQGIAAAGMKKFHEDHPEWRGYYHNKITESEKAKFEDMQGRFRGSRQRLMDKYGATTPESISNNIDKVRNHKDTIMSFLDGEMKKAQERKYQA